MKYIVFTILMIQTLFASINWMDDFNKAFAKAKELNKPLFVFIERLDPPCRWCHKMKTSTLADKEIAEYINEHFVAVKLDRDTSNYPDELYPRFVPTIYIITPKEKIVKKIVGYWEKGDFWSDLKDVRQYIKR